MKRVNIYIDYQNVYHRARGAFELEHADPWYGHVKPARLAHLLNMLGKAHDDERALHEVHIYRGEPGSRSHRKTQAAFQRQTAKWLRDDPELLRIHTRPLRYEPMQWDSTGRPTAWGAAREKGIDVMLALDLALGAQRNDFDVAIVVSGDTDLVPAIEAAMSFGRHTENAVWWPDDRPGRPLGLGNGQRLWCHRMTSTHFASVRDDTDYANA